MKLFLVFTSLFISITPVLTASTAFSFTVNSVNDVPIISAFANQTTPEDTPVVINFTISDLNNVLNCSTSMSAASTNTALIPVANVVFGGTAPNCTATVSPAANGFGVSNLTLTVTDTGTPVLTASTAFSFTVTSLNDAPILSAIGNRTALSISKPALADQEVVVLVPGFFNSFAPEYFSPQVIRAFQAQGFKVYVAEGMNPVGTIEDNGERLLKILARIEAVERRHVAFNVVGHSAGGLYTLYAATTQKFEIKNLLTVSTPYKGIEFVEKWLQDCTLFNAITSLAHLDGLKQLSPRLVEPFMKTVRVSPDMHIVAFGGTQSAGLDITNARNLSVPFFVTSSFISTASDGIVGFNSAMAVGSILTTQNTRAMQRAEPGYKINLDHWEQVLAGRSFIIMGIRNPSYIENEQARFYTGLAGYLKNLL